MNRIAPPALMPLRHKAQNTDWETRKYADRTIENRQINEGLGSL